MHVSSFFVFSYNQYVNLEFALSDIQFKINSL